MAELQTPVSFEDFSGGMIDSGAVSDSLLPQNCVRRAVNCVFDEPIGSIRKRKGSTELGNQIASGQVVRGLYNFRDAGTGSNSQLISVVNGSVYYLSGATWTSLNSGLSATAKARFVTFLDEVVLLNGTDAPRRWDGNTAGSFTTSGGNLDIANFPNTKFAVVFNSRIFAAGNSSNPSRLYESSLPSGGAISWTSNNDEIDVNPDDGDGNITALATNGSVILIFKERSTYRWSGVGGDPNRVITVGTPSHESVVSTADGKIYFFGQTNGSVGIYRTTGGYPELISKKIQKWIDGMSSASYENTAAWADYDHYNISIGDVTVDGVSYTNCVLRFTFSTQTWTVFSYPSEFRVFSPYISGTTLTTVGGDNDGNVITLESGTTDKGSTAVASEVEFVTSFGNRVRIKKIDELITNAPCSNGLQLSCAPDFDSFKVLGVVERGTTPFRTMPIMRGHTFRFLISATDAKDRWQFDGLIFNKLSLEGYD